MPPDLATPSLPSALVLDDGNDPAPIVSAIGDRCTLIGSIRDLGSALREHAGSTCLLVRGVTVESGAPHRLVERLGAEAQLLAVVGWADGDLARFDPPAIDLPRLLAHPPGPPLALVRTAPFRDAFERTVTDVASLDAALWATWIELARRGAEIAVEPRSAGRLRPAHPSAGPERDDLRALLAALRPLLLEHLEGALLEIDRMTGGLLRENAGREQNLAGTLEPKLDRVRHLVARRDELEATVAAGEAARLALTEALDATRFEVAALRRSWSWRLTRPLRWLADRLPFALRRRP